jgi:hypothetical protein
MLGSISKSREIAKNDASIPPFTTQNKIRYYLVTNIVSSVAEQIIYPLEAIFALTSEKESSSKSAQGEREASSYFVIYARTPNGIRNQILKVLSRTSEDGEKAFFIDDHLPLSDDDRLLLYHLLLQNYKYVYLLSSMFEEQDKSLDFTEIIPDEKSIVLFEQIAEFAPHANE